MRLRCSSLHRWGWVGVGVDEGVGNFPGSGWNLCNSQLLWMGFRLHCYKKVHTTFRRPVVRPAPCRQAAQGCRWGQGLQRLQVTSLPESLGFFGQKRLWKERDGFMELSVSALWDWAGFMFNFFFYSSHQTGCCRSGLKMTSDRPPRSDNLPCLFGQIWGRYLPRLLHRSRAFPPPTPTKRNARKERVLSQEQAWGEKKCWVLRE